MILFAINYRFLDNLTIDLLDESESGIVERVIDGDTIVVNGNSVRLLGINCPEKNENYYEESKKYLEERVLGKKIELRFGRERYDKYDRVLAYAFLNEENINLDLIVNGFANFYFPSGRDNYYNMFRNAWIDCINKNINLCESSTYSCKKCIEIISRSAIKNNCAFDCNISNWEIKGEGRQKFIFYNAVLESSRETFFDLELNPQDTLFLRDEFGKLVSWKDMK